MHVVYAIDCPLRKMFIFQYLIYSDHLNLFPYISCYMITLASSSICLLPCMNENGLNSSIIYTSSVNSVTDAKTLPNDS